MTAAKKKKKKKGMVTLTNNRKLMTLKDLNKIQKSQFFVRKLKRN